MDYLEIRELYHHGIKGQKWGIRKYQNEDGSLTPAGRERYGVNDDGSMSKEGKKLYKSDVKETRKAIKSDYKNIYNEKFKENSQRLYGPKHWTNMTDDELRTVRFNAGKDTSDALIKKYGERSVREYKQHSKNVAIGTSLVGSMLALAGTVAVTSYVMKDTGMDKALGKAGGKVFDNIGKAAFR